MSHPTKFVKIITPLAFAIALASCGGGGSEFGGGVNPPSGGDPVIVASALELNASSRQLGSAGAKPIVLSAIAKDSNNNAISGADIIFSVDNGATINTEDSSATSTGSVKTANLTPGLPKNRTLTVTATSGSQSKTILVDVVGTSVVIDGPDSITLGKDVAFLLKLKDSEDKPISFEPVELTAESGSTIKTESNLQTNAIGEIAFTLTASNGGQEKVIAKVLGAEFTKKVEISGDDFLLSSATEEIEINNDKIINFLWEKEGVPQANKPITISATRGTLSTQSVVTDSAGKASFTITSSTAGQTVIAATSTNGLSTSLTREFVATTPAYLNTQADPSLISPNGSSTIVAKIRDINDNPVKNKVIDFRLNDTVNGVLSASTAVTDSLGRASISYTAGNSSSAKDGVKVTTFIQGYPGVADDSVFLTVGGKALRIVLGHDHLVFKEDAFYKKNIAVIVTDSAGSPLKDQKVDFTITPKEYYKGFMRVVDTDGDGTGDSWAQFTTAPVCISEDFDNDGNLDAGEDLNNNGTLEPTRDATVTNSGITDEQGKITVELIYPKNTAMWSKQNITASTQVNGTEFVENTDMVLPLAGDDASDIKVAPPNILSPYGLSGSCFDVSDTYNAPIKATIVDAEFGFPVPSLQNNTWYKIRFVDALGNVITNKPFELESSAVDIEVDQFGNFKLTDKDTAVESSGFFIILTYDGKVVPLFYRDDKAIIPPTNDGAGGGTDTGTGDGAG